MKEYILAINHDESFDVALKAMRLLFTTRKIRQTTVSNVFIITCEYKSLKSLKKAIEEALKKAKVAACIFCDKAGADYQSFCVATSVKVGPLSNKGG